MITADAKLIYVEGRGLRYVETGGATYHVPREAQVTGVPGRNEPVRSAAGYLRPNAYRQSVAEARGVLFSG